ncbi:hypothetical protein KAU33_13960 [Candidatus Dependentiae bacterium]|nr:hypothetical protein [Candidatus Dependentiae bacterium]
MKIALVSEDKVNVSEHLGGAPYFIVVEVQDKVVTGKEDREKPGHDNFAVEEEHPQTGEKGHHGIGQQATERHKKIYEVIKDCDALIARRMGLGAYEDMTNFGLNVIATDVKTIDEAVSLYLDGKLVHIKDRIC